MATGQPPRPDSNCDMEAESVVLLEDQAERGSFDHKALADRRMEIEGEDILKLHLKVWEDDKKEQLLKIESYRDRCIAAMTEFYQLMGFYLVFQGVVFSAVSSKGKLSCPTAFLPFFLSLFTSIAAAVSIYYKLSFYETERLKFIGAECDVGNLIKKINKSKLQGKGFKFEEIDNPNKEDKRKKIAVAKKDHRSFYKYAMRFIGVVSFIVLVSCVVLPCSKIRTG